MGRAPTAQSLHGVLVAVLWISRKRDACATVNNFAMGNFMDNSMVGQPSPVAIMIIPYSHLLCIHSTATPAVGPESIV